MRYSSLSSITMRFSNILASFWAFILSLFIISLIFDPEILSLKKATGYGDSICLNWFGRSIGASYFEFGGYFYSSISGISVS